VIQRARRLAATPIPEHAKVRVVAACAVALCLAAAALAHSAAGPAETSLSATAGPHAAAVPAATTADGGDWRRAGRAARQFLTGYLAYVRGRARARQLAPATLALRRRLRAARVRVSPGARRRRGRVAAARLRRVSGRRFEVVAEITGGGARYPVLLTVEQRGGRWLVTAIGAD
jgi:hypothetical protein